MFDGEILSGWANPGGLQVAHDSACFIFSTSLE
jgi:hypothetical protein